jgi:hypothetical protein
MSYRILWVYEDLFGPKSGVVENPRNELFWFDRSLFNEKDYPEEEDTIDTNFEFFIYYLSDEDLEKIQKTRKILHDKVGLPYTYGDPFHIEQFTVLERLPKEELVNVELEYRSLVKTKNSENEYLCFSNNKILCLIHQDKMENFFIPHKIE